MRQALFLVTVFAVFVAVVIAGPEAHESSNQAPSDDVSWAREISGSKSVELRSFVRTADGGFVLAGQTDSSSFGRNDALCAKFNSSGTVVWKKLYGGSGSEWITSILQTQDQGFLLVGSSNTDYQTTYIWDSLVIKTSSTGSIQWRKYFHYQDASFLTSSSGFRRALQTSDGGYLLAGEAEDAGQRARLTLVKVDASGGFMWEKMYATADDDSCSGLVQTRDGGYLLFCRSWSIGGTYLDVRLLKVDSSGTPVWQKTYGKVNRDEPGDLIVHKDGGFVFAGMTEQTSGWGDAWVVRLDEDGNITWQKRYRGTKEEMFTSIRQTTDGGYLAAGYTNSFSSTYDAWYVKLSATGSIQWQYRLVGGDNEFAHQALQMPDGKYVLSGTSSAVDDAYVARSFLHQLSSTGMSSCPSMTVATKAKPLAAQVTVTSQQVTLLDHKLAYGESSIRSKSAKLTVSDACN